MTCGSAVKGSTKAVGLRQENLTPVVTDGALSAAGRNQGLVAHLKEVLAEESTSVNLPELHCILHQVALL